MMGDVRSMFGYKEYTPKYHDIDEEAFDLWKKEEREVMWQSFMEEGRNRTAMGDERLAESRGLHRNVYDRIAGDGRSYVEEQAQRMLDSSTAQTASLASRIPTGANTSAIGRSLVQAQSDQAADIMSQANLARIMEERQRNAQMLDAASALSGLDMRGLQLGLAQQGAAAGALTNLSGAVTGMRARGEEAALKQHMQLERQRQQAVQDHNAGLDAFWGGLRDMATMGMSALGKKKDTTGGGSGKKKLSEGMSEAEAAQWLKDNPLNKNPMGSRSPTVRTRYIPEFVGKDAPPEVWGAGGY